MGKRIYSVTINPSIVPTIITYRPSLSLLSEICSYWTWFETRMAAPLLCQFRLDVFPAKRPLVPPPFLILILFNFSYLDWGLHLH